MYVLPAGCGGEAGFRNAGGVLAPLAGSVRGLSAAGGTAPAQVGPRRDGEVLVVTERNTNVPGSFPVLADGTLGTCTSTTSPGLTPFGFAFTRRGQLVVSEAAAGATNASSASSYRFDRRAPTTPVPVSRAVPTTRAAACWIAVSPDGNCAYSGNAGSSSISISSYAIARNGALTLLQPQAGLTDANAGALDTAVTPNGLQLHVFASRGLQIVSFTVAEDGSLAPAGVAAGMPAGSAGLAVS